MAASAVGVAATEVGAVTPGSVGAVVAVAATLASVVGAVVSAMTVVEAVGAAMTVVEAVGAVGTPVGGVKSRSSGGLVSDSYE